MDSSLVVKEIYPSIQGESSYAGYPCSFVRLAGCNLRCIYCDTKYAYRGGKRLTIDSIVEKVKGLGLDMVEITGGEPLMQEGVYILMERLLEMGMKVLLETNGSKSIKRVVRGVKRVIDIKCPESQMSAYNLFDNLNHLRIGDEVKFVIMNRSDFDYSLSIIDRYDLTGRAEILFSPALPYLKPSVLAEWLVKEKVRARLQLPLHRVIYRRRRGV